MTRSRNQYLQYYETKAAPRVLAFWIAYIPKTEAIAPKTLSISEYQ